MEAYFGLKRMPFGKEIKSADLIARAGRFRPPNPESFRPPIPVS